MVPTHIPQRQQTVSILLKLTKSIVLTYIIFICIILHYYKLIVFIN